MTVSNDGYVLVSDIGIGDSGLHYNTDRSCCRASDSAAHGTLVPGTQVGSFTQENTGPGFPIETSALEIGKFG